MNHSSLANPPGSPGPRQPRQQNREASPALSGEPEEAVFNTVGVRPRRISRHSQIHYYL